MTAIVFGSPEARAIADARRAAEATERQLENPLPRHLTLLDRQNAQRNREEEQRRLDAWNRWTKANQSETTSAPIDTRP